MENFNFYEANRGIATDPDSLIPESFQVIEKIVQGGTIAAAIAGAFIIFALGAYMYAGRQSARQYRNN